MAAALLLPCCTLFVALDGLSSDDPRADVEAGSESGAPVEDAEVADRVGLDDTKAEPPDGGRYCLDAGGAFCADFDDGDLGAGWDEVSGSTAQLSLIDSGARSLPYALSVLAPVTSTQYEYGPYLLKRFAGPLSRWSCSFAFRHDGKVSGIKTYARADLDLSDGSVLSIYLTTSPSVGSFVWIFDPGGSEDRTVETRTTPIGGSPSFRDVTVELTQTRAAFAVDGAEVASISHPALSPFSLVRFWLGASILDDPNPQPWEAVFDDVRCATSP